MLGGGACRLPKRADTRRRVRDPSRATPPRFAGVGGDPRQGHINDYFDEMEAGGSSPGRRPPIPPRPMMTALAHVRFHPWSAAKRSTPPSIPAARAHLCLQRLVPTLPNRGRAGGRPGPRIRSCGQPRYRKDRHEAADCRVARPHGIPVRALSFHGAARNCWRTIWPTASICAAGGTRPDMVTCSTACAPEPGFSFDRPPHFDRPGGGTRRSHPHSCRRSRGTGGSQRSPTH